jgi:hypothetical protein
MNAGRVYAWCIHAKRIYAKRIHAQLTNATVLQNAGRENRSYYGCTQIENIQSADEQAPDYQYAAGSPQYCGMRKLRQ